MPVVGLLDLAPDVMGQSGFGEVTAYTVLGAPVAERATEPMDRDQLASDLPT